MAIKLEFFDFIVPIKTIKKKYPGGWVQCLKDHDGDIGGRVWYDEHLFRDGAMSPNDIAYLLNGGVRKVLKHSIKVMTLNG
jgi:hypothetical protein